jgi:mono/diheme cytochrome c family protein
MFCAALLGLMLVSGLAVAGDPVKGRAIYDLRCYGPNGIPQVAAIPNFKMGEGLMKPEAQLMSFIKNGKGVMRGFKGVLTDADIRNVIAHIRSFF